MTKTSRGKADGANSAGRMMGAPESLLAVKNLRVDLPLGGKYTRVLNNICFSLDSGEVCGLVGESGCGKSILARTLVRLESPGKIVSGSIRLNDLELTQQNRRQMGEIRKYRISLVLQDPKSAMDPVFTMGRQFKEVIKAREIEKQNRTASAIRRKRNELLTSAGIASPKERCRQYPHQWSRGMLQRAQMLMGFSGTPEVVILDEVTSALDPTITLQIIRFIRQLKERGNTAILFISHDLAVAGTLCDRLMVMKEGTIVESGQTDKILRTPSDAYTRRLVSAIFKYLQQPRPKKQTPALISLDNLGVRFPLKSESVFKNRYFNAVRRLTFTIAEQETFCLIGESGSGKSTLMNAILGLCPFWEGSLIYRNQTVSQPNDPIHRKLRSRAQVVFQNPSASLNPHLTIGQSVMEAIKKGTRAEKEQIVEAIAKEVGLSPSLLRKKPRALSGGQNQRACIARALAGGPEILFLDEPLSALDAVNKKEIARLLTGLIQRYGLTCFLITHDLGLVKHIGTTVGVMYLGQIVEKMPVASFFSAPVHPYSRALLTSCLAPGLWEGNPVILEGDVPSPHDPPSGCVFHPRCPKRLGVCSEQAPAPVSIAPGHVVSCHLTGLSGNEDDA